MLVERGVVDPSACVKSEIELYEILALQKSPFAFGTHKIMQSYSLEHLEHLLLALHELQYKMH